ncbi:MAG TPA: hypothetical protein VMU93_01285 [Caulobacteraceae bacterium]|nr:hypothetical protein [Caulobacteraceae bacterium]
MKPTRAAAFGLAGACLVVGAAIAGEMDDASFEMPRDVVSAATAFESYMKDAASIDGRFANGAAVLASVRAGASYEAEQLEEGMIAYGAIAALQDDRFVSGVDEAGGRGDARRALAERLVADPFAATRIDGAQSAVRRIEAALGERAAPLMRAGLEVKQAAYTVQHQAWSRVMVADAPARLAAVKRLSARPAQPGEAENDAMMSGLAGMDRAVAADDAPAGFSAIEARALALAAEAVLGHAHASDRDGLAPLLSESDSAECLKMSKLNLYQCMAVAGPAYEDMYCLGQHALYDTGQCVDDAVRGAGASVAQLSPRQASRVSYTSAPARRPLRIDPD